MIYGYVSDILMLPMNQVAIAYHVIHYDSLGTKAINVLSTLTLTTKGYGRKKSKFEGDIINNPNIHYGYIKNNTVVEVFNDLLSHFKTTWNGETGVLILPNQLLAQQDQLFGKDKQYVFEQLDSTNIGQTIGRQHADVMLGLAKNTSLAFEHFTCSVSDLWKYEITPLVDLFKRCFFIAGDEANYVYGTDAPNNFDDDDNEEDEEEQKKTGKDVIGVPKPDMTYHLLNRPLPLLQDIINHVNKTYPSYRPMYVVMDIFNKPEFVYYYTRHGSSILTMNTHKSVHYYFGCNYPIEVAAEIKPVGLSLYAINLYTPLIEILEASNKVMACKLSQDITRCKEYKHGAITKIDITDYLFEVIKDKLSIRKEFPPGVKQYVIDGIPVSSNKLIKLFIVAGGELPHRNSLKNIQHLLTRVELVIDERFVSVDTNEKIGGRYYGLLQFKDGSTMVTAAVFSNMYFKQAYR